MYLTNPRRPFFNMSQNIRHLKVYMVSLFQNRWNGCFKHTCSNQALEYWGHSYEAECDWNVEPQEWFLNVLTLIQCFVIKIETQLNCSNGQFCLYNQLHTNKTMNISKIVVSWLILGNTVDLNQRYHIKSYKLALKKRILKRPHRNILKQYQI